MRVTTLHGDAPGSPPFATKSGNPLSSKLDVELTPLPAYKVKAAFEANQRCYGSRRIVDELHAQNIVIGRYKVRRLMREAELRPVWKRKFVNTTDSKHDLPVAPNLLKRQFNPAESNRAWTSDITYIHTRAGWLYLAAVMDLHSRKIIGWA